MRTRRSKAADPRWPISPMPVKPVLRRQFRGWHEHLPESAAPGSTVVHVGFLGEEEVAYPVNTMVIRKEVTVCGSLR